MAGLTEALGLQIRRNAYGQASDFLRCIRFRGSIDGPAVYVASRYVRKLMQIIQNRKRRVEEGRVEQLESMATSAQDAPDDLQPSNDATGQMTGRRPTHVRLRDHVLVFLVSAVSGEVVWVERAFAYARVGDAISKANAARRAIADNPDLQQTFQYQLLDDAVGRQQIGDLVTPGEERLHVTVVAVPTSTEVRPQRSAPPL